LRENISEPVRRNVTGILEELYAGFVDTLAADRGVTEKQVGLWMEVGQFDPVDAIEYGLVDRSLFWEELVAGVQARHGSGRREKWSVSGEDYAAVPRASLDLKGDHIAVIHGSGNITSGESGWVFPMGATMGDETMVAALQEALESRRIRGVLLRLDTGGGLSTASDRIGEMVARVAEEKPVVISMVDMTASGGYMVSYRTKPLVASAASIVGSIGSISMNGNMTGLMNKLGVTIDRASVGPHPTLLSGFASMTEEEFARFELIHWRNYDRWVTGIAEHRGIPLPEVNGLAGGRIFTGRRALEVGLIDAIGGFDEALALLREELDIAEDEPVTYVHLPRQKDIWERLAAGEFMALAEAAARSASRGASRSPSQGASHSASRAGSWNTPHSGAAAGYDALHQARWDETLRFWQQCLSSQESLALCWWSF
jgi:protease IV